MSLELMATTHPVYIVGFVWGAVFLLVMLAVSILRSQSTLRARLSSQSTFGNHHVGAIQNASGQKRNPFKETFLKHAGQLFSVGGTSDVASLRRQLLLAGFFSPSAVWIYQGIRIAAGVSLSAFFLISITIFSLNVPSILVLPAAGAMCVVGLILPGVFLDWRRTRLRATYQNVFPDFMDLLVVCVEAGQSLPASLERVAKDVVRFSPELGANLHLANLELRAGRTLTESLAGLDERLGIPEVKSLNVLLKQSEELGTSIATTLRVFSDEMRDKRLMRAEAKAHALPVKMTIPLGLFIFPTVLMVILVPIVIRIRETFM